MSLYTEDRLFEAVRMTIPFPEFVDWVASSDRTPTAIENHESVIVLTWGFNWGSLRPSWKWWFRIVWDTVSDQVTYEETKSSGNSIVEEVHTSATFWSAIRNHIFDKTYFFERGYTIKTPEARLKYLYDVFIPKVDLSLVGTESEKAP